MSEAPVNTQTLARKEMAQIVVSAAVLYLSLNIRFTEFLDKLDYKNQDEIDIPLIMPNGIQYTDFAPIVPGQNTNSNSNITPNRGDEMILLAKLYYNGLQINKNKNELISFLCVSEGNYKEVYSLENSDYKDVPLSGLKEAIKGMKYNNRYSLYILSLNISCSNYSVFVSMIPTLGNGTSHSTSRFFCLFVSHILLHYYPLLFD